MSLVFFVISANDVGRHRKKSPLVCSDQIRLIESSFCTFKNKKPVCTVNELFIYGISSESMTSKQIKSKSGAINEAFKYENIICSTLNQSKIVCYQAIYCRQIRYTPQNPIT